MRDSSRRGLGVLAIASAAVIWGSNGVIVNLLPLNPFLIAFFRVFIASLSLLPPIAIVYGGEFLKALRRWRLLIVNGFLLCLGWAFLFASMKLIPIANAVLLNYLAPIFTAALSPILLGERLERSSILALALSFIGVLLIAGDEVSGDWISLLGILYGLLAGLSYAGFIIVSKRLRGSFSSLITAFYSYAFATLFLAIIAKPGIPALSPSAWILLLILGMVNTSSAVTLYLYGLGMIEAHKAVILTYLEPASATLFGLLFLDQIPGLQDILGGILIIISGLIVSRS